MMPEAFVVAAERVGDNGQRLVQMRFEERLIRHIVRNFAHAIHVVRKAEQPRLALALGQYFECMPHHRRARHFAERADVRQTRRAIARLEQNSLVFATRQLVETLNQPARFLEWPRSGVLDGLGIGNGGKVRQCGSGGRHRGHNFLRIWEGNAGRTP